MPEDRVALVLHQAKSQRPWRTLTDLMIFAVGGVVGLISGLGVVGLTAGVLGDALVGASPVLIALFAILCLLVLPIGLGWAAVVHSRREETREAIRDYFAKGECWFCHYDLAGVPQAEGFRTCPECGEVKFLVPADPADRVTP